MIINRSRDDVVTTQSDNSVGQFDCTGRYKSRYTLYLPIADVAINDVTIADVIVLYFFNNTMMNHDVFSSTSN